MALQTGSFKRPRNWSSSQSSQRTSSRILAILCLIGLGCQQQKTISGQSRELVDRIDQLQHRLTILEKENQTLKDRIQELTSRQPNQRPLEDLHLSRIRLSRYTGLYDKDGDGFAEQLIVYLQPLDEQDDIVKAPGTVDIQVWDLAAEPNQALIASWTIGPEGLRKMWTATFLTINYRLVFERPANLPEHKPFTIKAVFTDAITGKTFTNQRLIEPR